MMLCVLPTQIRAPPRQIKVPPRQIKVPPRQTNLGGLGIPGYSCPNVCTGSVARTMIFKRRASAHGGVVEKLCNFAYVVFSFFF